MLLLFESEILGGHKDLAAFARSSAELTLQAREGAPGFKLLMDLILRA